MKFEQYKNGAIITVHSGGPRGPKGEQGDTGAKGDKGEQGDTGAKGDKGEKGEKGDTGAKGDKGEKGDTGEVTQEEFDQQKDAINLKVAKVEEEIIDARDGEISLGKKIRKIDTIATETYSKSNSNRNPVLNLSAEKTRKPIVTFVDDDGNRAILTKLKPISLNQGIPFVVALIGNSIKSGLTLTANEALELQNELGWEVASHGQTHLGFLGQGVTDEQIEYEAKHSIEYLRSFGLNVKSFVYPGGQYDDRSIKIVSKYYNCAISTDINTNIPPYLTYKLKRISYPQTAPNNTLEYYKSKVDEAVANNSWLIWMLHCGQADFDAEQQQILEDLIVYIKSLDVDMLTVQEALDQSGNILSINNNDFFISADGDNNVRDLFYDRSNPVTGIGRFNFDSLPNSFPLRKVVVSYVYASNQMSKSPSLSRGYLVTNRDAELSFVTQTFYSNLSTYYRQSSDASTWSAWTRFFTGQEYNLTADFGTIQPMTAVSKNVIINGLDGGHYVMLTPSTQTMIPQGAMISWACTGGWVLTITIFNPTASAITIGNVTFNALHMKKP